MYFSDNSFIKCENINPYLLNAPNILVHSSSKPIFNSPKANFGSMPNDCNGLLGNYSEEQKNEIVNKYPFSEKCFKKIIGADEFIYNKVRWCLWFDGISPDIINKIPPIKKSISIIRESRLSSTREATRKLADTPYLFGENRHPDTNYILIPCHSSENRKYIPIGFMDKNVISTNANIIIPNATLYEFGVLTSNVHMAWTKTVCGRLKSDYRYSAKIVYNNFPWCSVTKEQKKKIEETAQAILDTRSLYPNTSLAELYNELTMPKELIKAHQENDKAVMKVYGFSTRTTELECLSELMKMYKEKVENMMF